MPDSSTHFTLQETGTHAANSETATHNHSNHSGNDRRIKTSQDC